MKDCAQHTQPIWGFRSTGTVSVELTDYGLPGKFESLDVQQQEDGLFVVCCIPFFVNGVALGDVIDWREQTDRVTVRQKSGHTVLRLAVVCPDDEESYHSFIHAWLEKERLFHEWRGVGYVTVDIPKGRALMIPQPLVDDESLGAIQIERPI
jgi:hypothetical protein